jgi:hypothetical protein
MNQNLTQGDLPSSVANPHRETVQPATGDDLKSYQDISNKYFEPVTQAVGSKSAAIAELAACLKDVLGANGDLNVMDFSRYRKALDDSKVFLNLPQSGKERYTPLFVAKCIRYANQYESTLAAMDDFGVKRIYFSHEMDERPELVTELTQLMEAGIPDRFFSIPNEEDMMPFEFTDRFSDEVKTKAFEKFFVRDSDEVSAAELFDGIAYASIEEPGYFYAAAIRTLITEFDACEITNLTLVEAVQQMLDEAIRS